jgi:hypothetical protein
MTTTQTTIITGTNFAEILLPHVGHKLICADSRDIDCTVFIACEDCNKILVKDDEAQPDAPAPEPELTPEEKFFYDHAGFSFNPKTETEEQGKVNCAKQRVKAVKYAEDHGWNYEWHADQNGCECEDGADHEVEYCILFDHGTVIESVGGVCNATAEYRRVVEADLALEVMTHREQKATLPPAPKPVLLLTPEQHTALIELMLDLDNINERMGDDDEGRAYWVSGNVRREQVNAIREFLGMEKV